MFPGNDFLNGSRACLAFSGVGTQGRALATEIDAVKRGECQ